MDKLLTILSGDCREQMRQLDSDSLDSCVTDPPYELVSSSKDKRDPRRASPSEKQRKKIGGFMNLQWDATGVAFDVAVWAEVLRVLKPGAHLLAFGGTRTAHRMAVAIEDAGFEIRDSIHWMYSSGFPKSLNVTKVAKESGLYCCCERPVIKLNQDDKRLRHSAATPRFPQMVEHALRPLQDSDLSPSVNAQAEQSQAVQPSLPQSGLQGDGRTRAESKTTRRKQSSVEGRRDSLAEARQLQADKVRALPDGIPADGAQGFIRDGASFDSGSSSEAMPNADRSSASHESQSTEQSVLEPATISEQQDTQTCGSCGKETFPEGLGTAIKPAHEIIYLARKPLSEKNLFENVRRWGTGALNVDKCRISVKGENLHTPQSNPKKRRGVVGKDLGISSAECGKFQSAQSESIERTNELGRWPANVILSHSPQCNGQCVEGCPIAELDAQSGTLQSGKTVTRKQTIKGYQGSVYGAESRGPEPVEWYGDSGSASRFYFTAEWSADDFAPLFFYVAKASRGERERGLDGIEIVLIEWAAWDGEARKVRLRVDTATLPLRVIDVSGIPASDVGEWNTFLFGSNTTALSRQPIKSITATKTSSIIESRTLSYLAHLLTSDNMAAVSGVGQSGGNPAENAANGIPSLIITNEKTVSLPGVDPAANVTQLRISGNVSSPADHPTVKPVTLMAYLCKLITPAGGIVLDCFAGSGTTGRAAIENGFRAVLIEQDPIWLEVINRRGATQIGLPLTSELSL